MRSGFILIFIFWQTSFSFAQLAPREYFKIAKFRYEQQKFDAALKMLNLAISADPVYVNAYYLRSEVKYSTGDFKGALKDIEQVLYLDSEENAYYPDYLLLRGKLYKKLNMNNKALIDFNSVILLSDTKDEAYFERAQIKKDKNNYAGAIADMNEAININPNNVDYYAIRAKIKRDFYHPNYTDKKYESILKDINKAISLDPDQFDYYEFRINLYMESGHKNRALQDLDYMTVKFPDQKFNYFSRGLIRMKDGFYKNAIADFNQAITLAPEDEKSYHYRGLCYHNTGHYIEARKDFTKAIEILSVKMSNHRDSDQRTKIKLAEVYILRGICLHQMGKLSLACGDFLQANKLGIGKGLYYYKKFCERY